MKYSNFYVKPSFCFGISLLLLVIPIKWVICWIIAAVAHEFGHFLALRLLHIEVTDVTIGLNGAVINTGSMTAREEAVCAAAGPLFGLSLVFLGEQFPTVAICAVLQSLYNILPIYPLDGGRVFFAIVQKIFGDRIGNRIYAVVGYGVITALNVLSAYLWLIIGIGPLPLICTFILGIRYIGKMTCKDGE